MKFCHFCKNQLAPSHTSNYRCDNCKIPVIHNYYDQHVTIIIYLTVDNNNYAIYLYPTIDTHPKYRKGGIYTLKDGNNTRIFSLETIDHINPDNCEDIVRRYLKLKAFL